MMKECKICKLMFSYPPSRNAKYCSLKCRDLDKEHNGQYKTGHKQTNTGKTWFKKGLSPWNKNLHGKKLLKHYSFGKINTSGLESFRPILSTPEFRKKLSLIHKQCFVNGLIPTWLGKKMPKYILDKKNKTLRSERNRQIMREHRLNQILPFKDTKIEIKIQDYLKELEIDFTTHYPIRDIIHKYCCDIYLPFFNKIIECDGDYWHGNPKKYCLNQLNKKQKDQMRRDFLRNKELQESGYSLLRIWESEIKKLTLGEFATLLATHHNAQGNI